MNGHVQVDGEEVFAQSAELTSCQLFVIEREAGDGPSYVADWHVFGAGCVVTTRSTGW